MKSIKYEELLRLLNNQGIILNDNIQKFMTKREKEKILSEHPYDIFVGGDGRVKTYVPDESKKSGRRLIAKSTREKVEDAIVDDYYNRMRKQTPKEQVFELKSDEQDTSFLSVGITLKDMYPEWLEYKSTQTDAATYIQRVHCDWKRYYVGTELIEKPIQQLTHVYLNKWAYNLIKENSLTKNQYYNITVIIRQLLDYCMEPETGLIKQNPFDRVKFKGKMFRKLKKPESETQVFTDKERHQIIKLAMHKFLKRPMYTTPLAIILNFTLGLRIGELSALKLTDIKGRHLQIQRSCVKDFDVTYAKEIKIEPKKDRIVDHTKSPAGERTLYLTNFAMEILNLLEESNKKYGYYDNDFLFVSIFNQRTSYDTIENCLWKLCKEVGIEVPKGNHKIRKTFISELFDADININTIREIAGHESEVTTLKNYCFDRTEKTVTEAKLDSMCDKLNVS